MNLPFAVTVSLNLKPNVKNTVVIIASFVAAKRQIEKFTLIRDSKPRPLRLSSSYLILPPAVLLYAYDSLKSENKVITVFRPFPIEVNCSPYREIVSCFFTVELWSRKYLQFEAFNRLTSGEYIHVMSMQSNSEPINGENGEHRSNKCLPSTERIKSLLTRKLSWKRE